MLPVDFVYISGSMFKFFGYQFQLSTLCGKFSCVFITTDVKIRIFQSILVGFRIFKQNRENPNEIRTVGQSRIWKTVHTILKS